jgi:glycosyltransferase involved in cell wall biosynthesis
MSVSALREEHSPVPSPDKTAAMPSQMEVALLTGGQDRHYAYGLAMALIGQGVGLDVIGSDLVDGPEMHATPRLRFLNLYGNKQPASTAVKVQRTLLSYLRLMQYAATSKPRIFHILWNNKFEFFDRTFLMAYYKLLGKKAILTAHNVNQGRRDGKDSLLNRLSLKIQYRLADHIFVHTARMKDELVEGFGVGPEAVTVISYGINNAIPDTSLTPAEARRRLGIRDGEKAILFFGAIKPYKGLEYLVAAFQRLTITEGDYRLIIAGEQKKGAEDYWNQIEKTIARHSSREQVLQKIEFIPDDETELYFKAADVAVLPYTEIFQSGILFLAYSFGLPVIATDVGSFAEDVVEGRNGFICKPADAADLARAIQKYFDSDLFRELEERRRGIKKDAVSRHSWDAVGEITRNVCSGLLA